MGMRNSTMISNNVRATSRSELTPLIIHRREFVVAPRIVLSGKEAVVELVINLSLMEAEGVRVIHPDYPFAKCVGVIAFANL